MKDSSRYVSEAVIRRLPRYYRHLEDLERKETERVSSRELAREMNLNASQIRQDFNCFGGFGQQGYGYHVATLRKEIGTILGLTKTYPAVLLGAGNIGQALAAYTGFASESMEIVAAFDVDDKLIGRTIGKIQVRGMDELEDFVREHRIYIGIIATPKDAAQTTADRLVRAGAKSIWNFAPVDVIADVPVENVHMSDSLHILTYRLNNLSGG